MISRQQATLSLVFLTGLNLFNYLDRYVLAAVLPPLSKELSLSDSEGGWLISAFMLGYFCTSPIFGYLGDRSPRKWLIAGGIFFWSLGTILSGMCHTYWTLIGCRLLVGLGEASYATLAPAWLADLFPAAKRNNALTIFYVAIPVGSALGYILGGLALEHGGWRTGFIWAGAPGLLLALLLLTLREPARGASDVPDAGTAAQPKPTWRDAVALFRIGDFNLVLLGYTAYTFALGAFAPWAPTFLNRVHGLDLSKGDHFFGLVLVFAGLVGTLLGGLAATAWQKRNPAGYSLMLTISVALAVPVAIGAFLAPNLSISMVLMGVAMFLLFLPTGPINTLVVESVPMALRASAMAASIFAIHLFGDLWSPPAIGWLADAWSSAGHPAAGLRQAVLVLPGALALAVGFWGWLAWRKRHLPSAGYVPP